MTDSRNIAAFLFSTVLNTAVLVVMWLIPLAAASYDDDLVFESILSEEPPEALDVTKVVEEDQTVSEEINAVAGGVVSTYVGSSEQLAATAKPIEIDEQLKDPDIEVKVNEREIVGEGEISVDLGAENIEGETGHFVDGYGTALKQLTREIVRLMRKDKLLVVWLFDQSESMKDDRREISENFSTVYQELKIVQEKDEDFRKRRGNSNRDAILQTGIVEFGKNVREVLAPTSNLDRIRAAIDNVNIDESGEERTCFAIAATIDRYRTRAARGKRKLVLIVVSDESGDDGRLVEDALKVATNPARVPLYFLGREAIFGYPFARVRWKDPTYGLWHWIRINRGPETAFPECLQWDGLHARWDAFSSGFGPYEQVRLARETGGIFFVLPGEEEDLSGAGAREERQFRALDMKEYQPLLLSRPEYARQRQNSEFRRTIWNVIVELNPNEHDQLPKHDRLLNMRQHRYPLSLVEFRKEALKEVQKAARAMVKLNSAIPLMEKIKPLRAKEESSRWRANYDLALAQLYAFRVRLFQYLLAFDDHVNAVPPRRPKKPKSNYWDVAWTRVTIEPDDAQFERIRGHFGIKMTKEEYLAKVKEQEETARELFELVKQEHPGTPWARRAEFELSRGFGMRFYERYWHPNYEKPIEKPKF